MVVRHRCYKTVRDKVISRASAFTHKMTTNENSALNRSDAITAVGAMEATACATVV